LTHFDKTGHLRTYIAIFIVPTAKEFSHGCVSSIHQLKSFSGDECSWRQTSFRCLDERISRYKIVILFKVIFDIVSLKITKVIWHT
jgi:hypothetical protein